MDAQIGNHILEALTKVLKVQAQFGENIDVDDLKKLAKRACSIEFDNVLEKTRIDNCTSTANSVAEFDEAFANQPASAQRFDENASVRYKEFARTANRLRDDAQTDDLESQTVHKIVDIDPLTKLPLQNPVRNKICNHIYGKDSIVKSLQQNSRLRCPHMGCANKKFVVLSDLIEDDSIMEQLVAQRSRKSLA